MDGLKLVAADPHSAALDVLQPWTPFINVQFKTDRDPLTASPESSWLLSYTSLLLAIPAALKSLLTSLLKYSYKVGRVRASPGSRTMPACGFSSHGGE